VAVCRQPLAAFKPTAAVLGFTSQGVDLSRRQNRHHVVDLRLGHVGQLLGCEGIDLFVYILKAKDAMVGKQSLNGSIPSSFSSFFEIAKTIERNFKQL
jgi:hypothetical protein